MFRITDTLATHGLGESFYPMPKDKLVTGSRLAGQLEDWIIVDVRDLKDEVGNTPMQYAEKIFDIHDHLKMVTEDNKVVVCCGAGQSRSNAIALGWLLYSGKTWEEAWKLVHAKGSPAMIDLSHLKALKQLFGIKDTFAGVELEHG